MAEGRQLIKDESVIPLSEDFAESHSEKGEERKLRSLINKFLKRDENK